MDNTNNYNQYYPRFVDSKESLSVLREKDVATQSGWDVSHPLLVNRPDPGRVDYFDVEYGSDPLQNMDIHHLISGNSHKPVIFYIHGGGWYMGDKSFSRFFGPTLISRGYVFVSINYRLVPHDAHPAQIEDCAQALKWVMDNIEKYGGDPYKIAVTGDSAGGHLAALLVAGRKWHKVYDIDISRVKCWIPISGVHDMYLKENYYSPMLIDIGNKFDFRKNKEDASPVMHITGNEPPSLIIHGGADWLVPKTNSLALCDELRKKGAQVELRVVEGYMHCNMSTEFGKSDHKPTEIINEYLSANFPAI